VSRAARLRDAVDAHWLSNPRSTDRDLSENLDSRLKELIQSKEQNKRLAGIAAFSALIDLHNEAYNERVLRTSNALRVLHTDRKFKIADIETAEASVLLLKKFSGQHGSTVYRVVRNSLGNAIRTMNEPKRSPITNVRNAMIIAELGSMVPELLIESLDSLVESLCVVVRNPKDGDSKQRRALRYYAVKAFETVFEICKDQDLRGDNKVERAVSIVRSDIDKSLIPPLIGEPPNQSNNTSVHEAILATGNLLEIVPLRPVFAGGGMYRRLGQAILAFRTSHDHDVLNAMVEVIPQFAKAYTDLFCEFGFLAESNHFLLGLVTEALTSPKNKKESVLPIGEKAVDSLGTVAMALAKKDLASLYEPYMPGALRLADSLLPGKSGLESPIPSNVALTFIERISYASEKGDPVFESWMRGKLLRKMFAANFTESLVSALRRVVIVIPSLENFMENNILVCIESVLAKKPAMKLDSKETDALSKTRPKPGSKEPDESSKRSSSVPLNVECCNRWVQDDVKTHFEQNQDESVEVALGYVSGLSDACIPTLAPLTNTATRQPRNEEIEIESRRSGMSESTWAICVALKTLADYKFLVLPSQRLAWFVNELVLRFVESSAIIVRCLAVRACASLMQAATTGKRTEQDRKQTADLRSDVYMILSSLVAVAAVDTSRHVRLMALRSLDHSNFDLYLVQTESLHHLGFCLYDEDYEVRSAALSLLCRISFKNDSQSYPILRRFLGRILTVVRCEGDSFAQVRTQATRLLHILVRHQADFAQLYACTVSEALFESLAKHFLVTAKADTNAALPALLALGDIAGTVTFSMAPYAERIIPLLISSVLDVETSDVEFRIAALRALARVIQNTAHAVKPYDNNARLLPALMRSLREETEDAIRIQTLELLGVIGAVNPDREEIRYASLPSFAPAGAMSDEPLRATQNAGMGLAGPGGQQPFHAVLGSVNTMYGSAQAIPVGSSNRLPLVGQAGSRDRSRCTGRVRGFCREEPQRGDESLPGLRSLPPLAGNGSLNTDLLWIRNEMRKTPDWARPSLQTESLVGRLEHPFTADPLYFPSAVLDALHKIVANSKNQPQHLDAVMAVVRLTSVIKSMNSCSDFLPIVVPRLLWMLRPVPSNRKRSFSAYQQHMFVQLAKLVSVVKSDFAEYLTDTVSLCNRYLADEVKEYREAAAIEVTFLLRELCLEMGKQFRPYAVYLLDPLISVMIKDRSIDRKCASAVIETLKVFGGHLIQYAEIAFSALVLIAEDTDASVNVRVEALEALGSLVKNLNPIGELASPLVHPLVRLLGKGIAGERTTNMDLTSTLGAREVAAVDRRLLCTSARSLLEISRCMPDEFLVFVPVVSKALMASGLVNSISSPTVTTDGTYLHDAQSLREVLLQMNAEVAAPLLGFKVEEVAPMIESLVVEEDGWSHQSYIRLVEVGDDIRVPIAERYETSKEILMERFHVRLDASKEDWNNWIDSLGAALFAQSSSPAIRSVAVLGERYPPFTRELFNAAFLSCWTSPLDAEAQQTIVDDFTSALNCPSLPLTVKQMLLDLFEFMDHDERPLPFQMDLIARAAVDVGAYAKALRYKETEYQSFIPNPQTLREMISGRYGLIEIYNHLGHTVSAVGTIVHFEHLANDDPGSSQVRQQYNETLHLLPEALVEYQNAATAYADVGVATVNANSYEEGQRLFSIGSGVGPVTQAALISGGSAGVQSSDDRRDLKWFLTLSQLRCLDRLGRWREMEELVSTTWQNAAGNAHALASLAREGRAASVAFDLSCWDRFRERVQRIEEDSWDGQFYRSLLCVRDSILEPEKLIDAKKHITAGRKLLDAGLTTRASEGYPRAYGDVLNAQHLVEMEEMINFLPFRQKAVNSDSSHRNLSGDLDIRTTGRTSDIEVDVALSNMKAEWQARLDDVKPDQHTWYRLLMIRALVLNPKECSDQWLQFATKCRKSGRLPMASEALRMLVSAYDSVSNGNSMSRDLEQANDLDGRLHVEEWTPDMVVGVKELSVKFALIKHLWACKRKIEAFNILHSCSEAFPCSLRTYGTRVSPMFFPVEENRGQQVTSASSDGGSHAQRRLYSEVWLKLAKWSQRILDQNEAPKCGITLDRDSPLNYADLATFASPDWYKAWHFWAAMNASQAKSLDKKCQRSDQRWLMYIANAISGYFQAIEKGGKTRLEDALTLLTLWFDHGAISQLSYVFDRGFLQSSPQCWLEVVPQIIARLHHRHRKVRSGIELLLTRIGKDHPHIVVYPLVVATSSAGSSPDQKTRKKLAEKVLNEIGKKHHEIVEQANLVSQELNRAAILDHEHWYDRIEEASRLYYGDGNILGMLDTLEPLHDRMKKEAPQTLFETKFRAEYGKDLTEAGRLCAEFRECYKERSSGSEGQPIRSVSEREQKLIDNAWERYYHVFRKIQKQQAGMTILDLELVSPKLEKCQDMALVVPGTYKPNDECPITISHFEPQLQVIPSKQRPRRLIVHGSDGKLHDFLLKGHDDLRQDERVMQVFGLINVHLARSEERSIRSGAELKRYAVVVISGNAGLIEWVPDCDTMHALVKEFRENRKVMPNIEHKVMTRLAPEPERLPLLHKVDLFEFMLANTGGRDIARVLWLKSRNSEMWLDRRTNFARTLATTSMAGYLLGLGDRHPSNLMIERSTGKIMHIDFGDCFEVAMRREKYPEKVPFRLTRMLVHALEPCGVEGYFRHTAVAMMKVLRRENTRAALISMMNAFVHDPLIRQRLFDGFELYAIGDQGIQGRENQDVSSISRSSRLAQAYNESGNLHDAALRENGDLPFSQTGGEIPEVGVTPSQHSRRLLNRALPGGELNERFSKIAERRAADAIGRVEKKLTGLDFDDCEGAVDEKVQVDKLIEQATSIENLCQLFPGWVASW
jgi:Phosphatidylinositol 3- and 4-kinase/FAT domain/FKBP12-rapamycin binding domain/Domain of unknown function (DUF3385)/FATC domain